MTSEIRLNRIIADLPMKKSQWETNVANPYVRAFDLALIEYDKVLKEQQARVKMAAELFIFSASILTGSIMMAAFASTSLRPLVGNAALNVVCNRNLDRIFNGMYFVASNKALMFGLGKLLDKGKDAVGKQASDAVENYLKGAAVTAPSAINMLTRVTDFINVSHIAVHHAATAARDNGALSEAGRNAMADMIEQTPFYNPPETSTVNELTLSRKMELLFYMGMLLDSDRLVQWAPSIFGNGKLEFGRAPINAMPSDANYPKEIAPEQRFGRLWLPYYEPGQSIQYSDPGAAFRARIDTLVGTIGEAPFFAEKDAYQQLLNPVGAVDLRRAERIIQNLALQTAPPSLTEVVAL